MSRIDLLYLCYLYFCFSLVGGGGGVSVYSKIQVEETKTIQIKVVYDCAEIT